MDRTNSLHLAHIRASVKVFLFDLWKTLARGPYPEPIAHLHTILGLDERSDRPDREEFLRFCLTTPHEDRRVYLQTVAARFGVHLVSEDMVQQFTELVDLETFGLLWYIEVKSTLEKLQAQGYRLGLVTNSWPFPVRKFLTNTGLIDMFEHVIISAEVGLAKQEGPEIYRLAAQLFGVRPEQICMVGDNPVLDVIPAREAGLCTVLIDRYTDYVDLHGNWKKPEFANLEVPVIRCLDQLSDPKQ